MDDKKREQEEESGISDRFGKILGDMCPRALLVFLDLCLQIGGQT